MEWVIAALVFGGIYLVALGPAVAGLMARPPEATPPPEDLARFLDEHLEFARQCRASIPLDPDQPGGSNR